MERHRSIRNFAAYVDERTSAVPKMIDGYTRAIHNSPNIRLEYATQIKEGLEPQAPRVVQLTRTAVGLFFVLVQAIPFGLIGWAAYTDIKVRL